MNATEGVQTIPHQTHTRALFLVAHFITRDCTCGSWYGESQGMMSLCESSQNHSFTGHVVVGCSFDSNPSYVFFILHLKYNTPLQRYQLESDLTPVLLRSGLDSLAD